MLPYALHGNDIQLTPTMTYALPFSSSITAAVMLERRRYNIIEKWETDSAVYKLAYPLFLWESINAVEPQLSISYSAECVQASLTGSYRQENVLNEKVYAGVDDSYADFREWKLNLTAAWRAYRRISFNSIVTMEYRKYAPYRSTSRRWLNSYGLLECSVEW
jgi:hypothetical protein